MYSKIASKIDDIANILEFYGLKKEALELDRMSDELETVEAEIGLPGDSFTTSEKIKELKPAVEKMKNTPLAKKVDLYKLYVKEFGNEYGPAFFDLASTAAQSATPEKFLGSWQGLLADHRSNKELSPAVVVNIKKNKEIPVLEQRRMNVSPKLDVQPVTKWAAQLKEMTKELHKKGFFKEAAEILNIHQELLGIV